MTIMFIVDVFNVHSLMSIMNFIEIFHIFFNFHIFSHSNLMLNFMPIFIAKIYSANFLLNFKVVEFEYELEPGDLGPYWPHNLFSLNVESFMMYHWLQQFLQDV